ncbi:MAG: hypothetical protein C0506_15765 [Anaerolinea sp.]|nr:hypothetical protein [Anaerolinea sp.]
MNTRVKSVPKFPGATGPSGRKALFALLGGGAVLAAAFGASVYSRSTSDEPAAPPAVSAPAAQANEGSAALAPGRALASRSVYVVASEEQAALVWLGVRDANDILAWLGEPPSDDSVVVVPSGVQATEVMDAIAEGNRILATLGGPVSVVVDLR